VILGLAAGVRAGDRRALAQAITLVESTRDDHRSDAAELLDAILPRTGHSIRLAVTGSPGAGKSSLIEALGVRLVAEGHRVAVLAIDPSSQRSGGSILGDKTRMDQLAREPAAFIRPSPSGGTLGGVARRTREAMLLCEAAGFDVVIVETVGVGQSETAAADMVDCVLLVASPSGGDELQGIKRGIMEFADVVAVNKADGDLLATAARASGDLRTALHLLPERHPGWQVPVLLTSARVGEGIDEIWSRVKAMVDHLEERDARRSLRSEQAVRWMWSEVRETVLRQFDRRPAVTAEAHRLEELVRSNEISATAAAQRLLHLGQPPGLTA